MHIDIPKYLFIFPVLALVSGFYSASLLPGTSCISMVLIILDIVISASLIISLFVFLYNSYNIKRLMVIFFIALTACMFITGLLRSTLFARGKEVDKDYLYCLSKNSEGGIIGLEGRVVSVPYIKYGKYNFEFRLDRIVSAKTPEDTFVSGQKAYVQYGFGDNKITKDCYLRLEAIPLAGSPGEPLKLKAVGISQCKGHIKGTLYPLRSVIYRCVKRVLDDNLGGECLQLASALLLGDRTMMSESDLSHFKKSGLYHILAVSGLHISIFSLMVFGVTSKLTGSNKVSSFLVFFLLIIYNLVIGLRASSLRASIMVMILLLSNFTKREASRIYILSIPFCGMLLIFPQYFEDVGFWLSFMSISCIFFILPLIGRCFAKIFKTRPRIAKNRVLNIVIAAVVINTVIWPLISYFFGYIQFLSPLSNLFILPVFPLLMFLLFSGGISALFSEVVGGMFFKISWPLLKYVSMTAKAVSGLGNSVVFIKIPKTAMVIYYLLIACLLLLIHKRLKNNENKV